MHSSASK